VITEAQVEAYRRDGFTVVENLMTSADASAMRQVIAEFVAGARRGRDPYGGVRPRAWAHASGPQGPAHQDAAAAASRRVDAS
jgi:hypothetical protein